MKKMVIVIGLFLSGCSDEPKTTGDYVILENKGELRRSEVKKTGVYCTSGWYRSIDNFVLRSDGTAVDGIFKYRWFLRESGNPENKIWFDQNCKEL